MNLTNQTQIFVCQISLVEWIFQFGVVPCLIFLYVSVLLTISLCKTDFKNPFFIFVIALGISNLTLIIYLYHQFFCCFFNGNYLGKTFDAVITFIFISIGWYSALYLNVLISLNRFSAIVLFSKYKLMWSENRSKVMVAVSAASGIGSTLFYFIPGPTIFDIETKHIQPTTSSKARMIFDMISGYGSAIVILVIYSATTILCIVRYKKFSHNIKKKYVREVKLFVQGIFIALLLTIQLTFYYFTVKIREMDLSYFATVTTAINPIIALLINQRLREKLLQLFKCSIRTNLNSSQHLHQSTNLRNSTESKM